MGPRIRQRSSQDAVNRNSTRKDVDREDKRERPRRARIHRSLQMCQILQILRTSQSRRILSRDAVNQNTTRTGVDREEKQKRPRRARIRLEAHGPQVGIRRSSIQMCQSRQIRQILQLCQSRSRDAVDREHKRKRSESERDSYMLILVEALAIAHFFIEYVRRVQT